MQTKTTIRFFTIADYEKEQDNVRAMVKELCGKYPLYEK